MVAQPPPLGRSLILLAVAAATAAGCTGPAPDSGYGAFYAAKVTGASGCTVHLPWPYHNGTAYGPLDTAPGTRAELVATAYGQALRMSGTKDLAVNSSKVDTEPFPHQLSMQQTDWSAASPPGELATFWIGAEGCRGASLELTWVHDVRAGLAHAVSVKSVLTDGWVETQAQRTEL